MDELCDDCEGGGSSKEEKEVDNCDLEQVISFLKHRVPTKHLSVTDLFGKGEVTCTQALT